MWHKVTCHLSDSGASDVHRQSIGPCLPFEVAAEAGAFRVLWERFVPCNTLNISIKWLKKDPFKWRRYTYMKTLTALVWKTLKTLWSANIVVSQKDAQKTISFIKEPLPAKMNFDATRMRWWCLEREILRMQKLRVSPVWSSADLNFVLVFSRTSMLKESLLDKEKKIKTDSINGLTLEALPSLDKQAQASYLLTINRHLSVSQSCLHVVPLS